MKTAAKILLLAALVALFAFIGITYGVPVEVNESITYMKTNLYLADDTNTPVHTRLNTLNLAAAWTNGLRASVTNTIEEIVEVFIEKEGWQGKLGIYDPTNGLYRLYPHDGIIKGSYTNDPPVSLWDGHDGNWLGGYSNSASTLYASNLVLTGNGPTVLARDVMNMSAFSVGEYGVAFGYEPTARAYGAAFGHQPQAGEYGFSAGRYAINTNVGSFVFADSTFYDFDRDPYPNSFSVRASGGTYFDTPEMVVTGAVTATMFYLRTDKSSWLYSDGTNLFFVSTVSPGFTNALTTNAP